MLMCCACWSINVICSVLHRTTISYPTTFPLAPTFAIMSNGSYTAPHHTTPHWCGMVRYDFIRAQVYFQFYRLYFTIGCTTLCIPSWQNLFLIVCDNSPWNIYSITIYSYGTFSPNFVTAVHFVQKLKNMECYFWHNHYKM